MLHCKGGHLSLGCAPGRAVATAPIPPVWGHGGGPFDVCEAEPCERCCRELWLSSKMSSVAARICMDGLRTSPPAHAWTDCVCRHCLLGRTRHCRNALSSRPPLVWRDTVMVTARGARPDLWMAWSSAAWRGPAEGGLVAARPGVEQRGVPVRGGS